MAAIHRIEVGLRENLADPEAAGLPAQFASLGLKAPERARIARLYWVEADLDAANAQRLAGEMFADPITEKAAVGTPVYAEAAAPRRLEIVFKPGVMDPVVGSIRKALRDRGIDAGHIATGKKFLLWGALDDETLRTAGRRILANESIQEIHLDCDAPVHRIHGEARFELRHVPLAGKNDDELLAISKQGCLSLTAAEMRQIQAHYETLKRDPTDVELETLAQTWSEHCRHKTLKGAVYYTGAGEEERRYENLLKETIVRATNQINHPLCLSVFKDNAGIVAFDEQWAVTFKVETHNHPSAIEPYGGAGTGAGGCIRDTLGTGLGAKPIANTDVFCFGLPDHPFEDLPAGTLHPRRVMQGVVSGVRDYGNRMGIPTVNGAVHFDPRYVGNPLVYCGSVGLIPRGKIEKRARPGDLIAVLGGRTGRDGIHGATFSSVELTSESETVSSGAVQIGNAIEEKKVLDVLLQARDAGLYSCITDCGAGGLSSAVGEMGEETGAEVRLETVPLKYAGLSYTEIWISEAQERMVLAVPPEKWQALQKLCAAEDVEATAIGSYTSDGMLRLFYRGAKVGELTMAFLHGGLPKVERKAEWPIASLSLEGLAEQFNMEMVDLESLDIPEEVLALVPTEECRMRNVLPIDWYEGVLTLAISDPRMIESVDEIRHMLHVQVEPILADPKAIAAEVEKYYGAASAETVRKSASKTLKQLLAHPTIASKEWIVRQYDHEVQGRTAIKPLVGRQDDGPGDAAVLTPVLGSTKGVALSNGLCPQFTDLDPREMAKLAVDEAVRNAVAVGADPAQCFILDNFSWGNTAKPEQLGSLVLACEGAAEAAIAFGTPFISGKDSLNNEYAVGGKTIAIPGTLLISALSIVPDVRQCVTMDLKKPGNKIFVVGETRAELGGSHSYLVNRRASTEGSVPRVHLELAKRIYAKMHAAIRRGLVAACHDGSEGGLAVAAAEMAIAGGLGINIGLDGIPTPEGEALDAATRLFSESPSRFVVEVKEDRYTEFQDLMAGLPCRGVGHVIDEPFVRFQIAEGPDKVAQVLNEPIAELKRVWQGAFAVR